MKIAITSDLHLKSKNETPDLYNTLKEILTYLQSNSISHLIIAGDTFDKNIHNTSDFVNICNEFNKINVYIIKGNHDANLQQSLFISQNIKVIEQPTFFPLSDKMYALLIPYENKSMDEVLVSMENEIKERKKPWILIGHGTYFSRIAMLSNLPCIHEKDNRSYMPLSKRIIEKLSPEYVFLGHIHKPFVEDNVISPGSPYPLDHTEKGKRRFLVFDAIDCNYYSVPLESRIIYLEETFFIIPSMDKNTDSEMNMLKSQWNAISIYNELSNSDMNKVILTAHLKGWTTNAMKLAQDMEKYFLKDVKINKLNLKHENLNHFDFQALSNNYEHLFIKNLLIKIDDFLQNSTYQELNNLVKIKVFDIIFKK